MRRLPLAVAGLLVAAAPAPAVSGRSRPLRLPVRRCGATG